MIGVKWTGWDGSEWDLKNGSVHLTPGGIKGLGSLEADTFVSTTALLDGQRFKGWRAKPRDVLLPVLLGQGATELEWLAIERKWWRTMQPGKTGIIAVTAPDGLTRRLKARFVDDGDMAYDHDPSRDRLSVAVLSLIADDPYWYGDAFTQSFSGGSDPVNFFGGAAGKATPFYVGSSSTLGASKVVNPGDVDTWPLYLIDGPVTAFSVTVAGAPIAGTMPVPAGSQLQIDTDPTRQTATLVTGGTIGDNGVMVGGVATDVITLLSAVQFSRIPAGGTVNFNVSVTGVGRVTMLGSPRYFRAW